MKITRIEGIDYLRAIMSVLVVIQHMRGAGHSLIFSKEKYLEHVFTLSDFINFHILHLAVPTFILISNYLFILKGVNLESLKKRLKRIFILLSFWPLALIIYRKSVYGLPEYIPNSFDTLIVMTLTAGHTLYYFFVSMMISILVTYFIANLKNSVIFAGYIVSIVFLSLFPFLTNFFTFYPLSAYWNPLNFIPFSFAAILLYRFKNQLASRRILLICFAALLAIAFSIKEWTFDIGSIFFPGQGAAIPIYTRASLQFSTVAIFLLSLSRGIKSNVIVRFMARHALALYCLHQFFIYPVPHILSNYIGPGPVFRYFSILLIIASSYIMSVISKFYLKDYVVR